MYCSKCGKQIADGSSFCSDCGTRLGSAPQSRPYKPNPRDGTRDQEKRSDYVYPKNPPLSIHMCWLTLIITGLPQLIFGQKAKGFAWFGIYLLVAVLIGFFGLVEVEGTGFLVLLAIIVDIPAIVDSYKIGKKLASGQPVGKWEWFPSV